MIGVTNVGKSSLTNAIVKYETGISDILTTSHFPGTTLDMIKIPLNDGSTIIDTPGIIVKTQMAHYLNVKDLKLVSPKKKIKPKTFQLNPSQSLFIGGLSRFDFIDGDKMGITTYFENNLEIHRTKLENADEFYRLHQDDLLSPSPVSSLVKQEFTVKAKSDLVISGLGWLNIPNRAKISLWAPDGVEVLIRKALI
jgi:ribosome biogenesis GTPase A